MKLKPDVEKFLAALQALGRKPLDEGTPAEARAGVVARRAAIGPGVKVPVAEDKTIPTATGPIQARFFKPEGKPLSLIVYLHGGGWVIGGIDDFDAFARQLATDTKSAVLLVDYRLAPERRFPSQVDDAWTALEWAAINRRTLLGFEAPLVIAGDSAGGNLAAVCTLRARERGAPKIDLQVLVYPVTDADFDTPSYGTYADGPFLTRKTMQWFWDHYAPDPAARKGQEAAPLRARSHADLPPAVILMAEYDPLRSEIEAYAEKLKQAGVPVTFRRFDGTIHSFFTMLNILDDCRTGINFVGEEIAKAFGAPKTVAAD